MLSYSAKVFHSSWAEHSVPGTVTVEPQNFVFRGDGIELVIPLDQLVITSVARNHLRFHDAEQEDWSIETSDQGILQNYFFTRRHAVRQQVRAITARQEGLQRLRMTPVFLLLFFAIVASAWLLSSRSVDYLVSRVPFSWESELGDELLKQLAADSKLQSSTERTGYLEELSNRLLPASSKGKVRIRIFILDDPHVNAMALPGGIIIINSGTLESVRAPEQLAGILAHEIAHILERHSLRKFIGYAGPQFAFRLFIRDKTGFLNGLAHSSHVLLRQNFSREYEREADERATQLLTDARMDPRGLVEALRYMQANQLVPAGTNTPRLLSSHPATEERIRHLEALLKTGSRKR